MLLQSDDPYGTPTSLTPAQSGSGAAFVHLLPALPTALPGGSVSGLLSRGGLEVSIAWQNGKLTKAAIAAKDSKSVTVRYAGRETEIQVKPGRIYELGQDLKVL